jgi:transposase-like protein
MIRCKFCNDKNCIKNGLTRNKQRYKCKKCNKSHTIGDDRIKARECEKSLALILYSTGKASYRFIARLLNINATTVYNWIKSKAKKYKEKEITNNCTQIEIDEMWHFIQKKVIKFGYLKQLTEKQESVLHMLLDKEILRQYISSMKS